MNEHFLVNKGNMEGQTKQLQQQFSIWGAH